MRDAYFEEPESNQLITLSQKIHFLLLKRNYSNMNPLASPTAKRIIVVYQ